MGSTSSGLVAGVDGCRRGWAVVISGPEPGSPVEVVLLPRIAPLVARLTRGELDAVAVDMPIGLPERERRRCDVEARALLGRRASTVFPAPVRATLGSVDHAEACRRSRAVSGQGLSIQAFNLLPKIAELDRSVPPTLSDRFVEAHPELAFQRLHDGVGLSPKRTDEGRRQRLSLIAAVVGAELDLPTAARSARVPLGDALDAAALVATARRIASGSATLLGGQRDGTGRPMQVAW